MGKLRESLKALAATMEGIGQQVESVCSDLQSHATQNSNAGGMVREGYVALYQYVIARYKIKGEAPFGKDSLETISDSTIKAMIKSIENARPTALKKIKDYEDFIKGDYARVMELSALVGPKAEEIQKVIDKKKSRLIKTKKFKGKMKDYEEQLATIKKTVTSIKNEAKLKNNETASSMKPDLIAKSIDIKITVDELKKRVDATYDPEQFEVAVRQKARKWREWNHFPDMATQMKKWVAEADEMDTAGGS